MTDCTNTNCLRLELAGFFLSFPLPRSTIWHRALQEARGPVYGQIVLDNFGLCRLHLAHVTSTMREMENGPVR